MAEAPVRQLIADIGAEFRLEILHRDSDGVTIDYSSGWTGRFVMKYGYCGEDVVDSEDVVTLSDGASGVNVLVSIGKTETLQWRSTIEAVYELQVWPTATPELVKILLKGTMVVRSGVD